MKKLLTLIWFWIVESFETVYDGLGWPLLWDRAWKVAHTEGGNKPWYITEDMWGHVLDKAEEDANRELLSILSDHAGSTCTEADLKQVLISLRDDPQA